ncbi:MULTISPECIES: DJ-1/PfpI family protein [Rahnella]|uniref:DJ-1/PfpI family protein n=1 Tax=Rahnella laticis TaxID=2787622 RepID=A0ABS0EFK5_9GAMM|nr:MULTISPECIES: DJ-1/PfpI family protein [Rahnella]MBF7982064.1 DJ-1/PfpI family protein [Rahnella laticis]MBF8002154.1 DJ-1/PfpI family protein [Rahnella sp. LAC-M12]
MSDSSCISIGLLLFPALTQLDLTGPYEVLARAPNTKVHLIWKSLNLVVSDRGMAIQPTTTFETCPDLDVICVPGGPGQIYLMDDEEVLSFIRTQSKQAKLVTSVCTGSLVLGAAGLLDGYKATTHWASLDQLALLGAEPVNERVVRDRNRITGAGVTSGIDFALNVVSEMYGSDIAQNIQLHMEYDPAPPFTSGSPRTACEEQIKIAKEQIAPFIEKRRRATLKAAAKLKK